MTGLSPMLRSHSETPPETDAVTYGVDACFECAEACTACSDACLSEKEEFETLLACIRANLDCALICSTTGTVLSRMHRRDGGQRVSQAQIAACMMACRACGEECAKHAEEHEHCRVCAEACAACEIACAEILRIVKVH